MTKQVYTLKEAETETGIKYDTLKKRCQKGKIAATKIGRMWVLSQEVVDGLKEGK